VTDTYEYDAFGNSFTVSGSTPNEFLYRGEQYDSDLGLYYLRARYYNPVTGRFMSKDSLGGLRSIPATLHKYLYAGADPVNRIDPQGRLELVTYAVKLETTLRATVVLNAIGCGVSIGSSLATGSLLEAFGDDRTGTAFTAFGCLTMTVAATGKVQVAFDAVAIAGCAYGLYVAYQAENVYFDDLDTQNYEKAEDDLQKVDADLFGSIGGCAITLASVALEPVINFMRATGRDWRS
jgi:RHS repeat-associated protein